MQSTRQFKKVTRKEPTVSSGISVHTSEPLYVKGQAKTQVNVPEVSFDKLSDKTNY